MFIFLLTKELSEAYCLHNKSHYNVEEDICVHSLQGWVCQQIPRYRYCDDIVGSLVLLQNMNTV